MNKKLISKLSSKWSQPNSLPAKGYEMVAGEESLSPCAQSEALMMHKGIGVMDFMAFRTQGTGLDKSTAKALGISVIHSVLLRRFNDLSSHNPAIVLNEPERVLGRNWEKVLEFWYYVSSLSSRDVRQLLEKFPSEARQSEYESKKAELKVATQTLNVITPDLHYPTWASVPLDPSLVNHKTKEEVSKTHPLFKLNYTSNQHSPRYLSNSEDKENSKSVIVVGEYSSAYFGWIAPYDYFRSNFPSGSGGLNTITIQVLFACATNEIQILNNSQGYEDLYFCKILGYNPFKGNTLRKLQREFKEHKQSLLGASLRFYRIVDNYIFSRLSKDPEVNKALTKQMIEGDLELTENDIVEGKALSKIQETYEVGKGRFFGSLHITVPKFGLDSEADAKFYELVQELKKNFYVQPLSFCEEKGPSSKDGSVWAIWSRKEACPRRRFNSPTGRSSEN